MTAIDVKAWAEETRASGKDEDYLQLAKGRTWRVGIISRRSDRNRSDLLIEVVLSLFPAPPKVDVQMLGTCLEYLKRLDALGYSLAHEDNGYISCERKVKAMALDRQLKLVLAVLQ